MQSGLERAHQTTASASGAGALYVRDGSSFVPTLLTQGPWNPEHQFGGAPAALVAQVLETVPTLVPMGVTRFTVDLLRPVPIQPLQVEAIVRREGKRIQVVDVGVYADGVEVVRVTATRLRVGDLAGAVLPAGVARQGPPAVPTVHRFDREAGSEAPVGMQDTIEYACDDPAAVFVAPTWARLTVPVVEGEPTAPLARMAYVADACSGVGERHRPDVSAINVDITVNVIRPCEGEWLCVTGATYTSELGMGVSQATLSDERGVVGVVSLSRLVDRVR